MFKDREDAGMKLARALENYKGQHVCVIAIPKGGIEIGYQVATCLDADFSVVITRKLPFPDNPEAGFGAIAEDGSIFIYPGARHWLTEEQITRIVARQKKEVERRLALFREGAPLPALAQRTVVLVDDGIAMGSTMRATIRFCRHKQVAAIIVAVPVAGKSVIQEIAQEADQVVVLEQPDYFRAVAQVYLHWSDVSDHEALTLLKRWKREHT